MEELGEDEAEDEAGLEEGPEDGLEDGALELGDELGAEDGVLELTPDEGAELGLEEGPEDGDELGALEGVLELKPDEGAELGLDEAPEDGPEDGALELGDELGALEGEDEGPEDGAELGLDAGGRVAASASKTCFWIASTFLIILAKLEMSIPLLLMCLFYQNFVSFTVLIHADLKDSLNALEVLNFFRHCLASLQVIKASEPAHFLIAYQAVEPIF